MLGLLWLSLLSAQVLYVGILTSGALSRPDAPSVTALFPIVLGVVGAVQAGVAHYLWRRASGAALPLHAAPPDPPAAFQGYLLAWVIDESIAIYGLVLGMLGFPVAVWSGFSAVGFVLLLLHRPAASG